MRWIAVLLLPIAAGCGPGQRSLMPLEVGHAWTYHVFSGMDTRIEEIKVVRPVSVLDVEGYELNSALGVSRMAWKDQTLLLDTSAGLRFSPPIPLIPENGKSSTWSGTVTYMGRLIPGITAELTQTHQVVTLVARNIDAVRTDLNFHLPKRDYHLATWFEPGVGIVKQEQRSNGKLDIGLEMVSGP